MRTLPDIKSLPMWAQIYIQKLRDRASDTIKLRQALEQAENRNYALVREIDELTITIHTLKRINYRDDTTQ